MNRDRASAVAIILGAVAFVVTMALHPTGGDLDHIIKIAPVVVGTHSLALASLALVVLGFLGLTVRLSEDNVLAPAGMVTFAFGAIAAMCAAVLNGLALPAFVRQHAQSDAATLEVIRLILGYNHALNAAFARVFMAATAVAVVFWSIAIVRTRSLPSWTGVVGGVAGVGALGMLLVGAIGVDVHDFGLFVFGYSAWAILIALQLWRRASPPPSPSVGGRVQQP